MTKYQEKKFKNYLGHIEEMTRDICFWDEPEFADKQLELFKAVKKERIEFFNWFKKQLK